MTSLIKKKILEAVKREFYKEWEKVALGQLKQNLSEELKREILEETREEMFGPKTVYLEVCREHIPEPNYKHLGDAGMDVVAAEDFTIMPGQTVKIPTGLIVGIPWGHEILIRPRSGISFNTQLRVSNSPGNVDWGFRDEFSVLITNISPIAYYNETGELVGLGPNFPVYGIEDKENKPGIYKIYKGDRIAQIVLVRYEEMVFERKEPGFMKTLGHDRGGGFGHTGVK